jgi:hypothetical protein
MGQESAFELLKVNNLLPPGWCAVLEILLHEAIAI